MIVEVADEIAPAIIVDFSNFEDFEDALQMLTDAMNQTNIYGVYPYSKSLKHWVFYIKNIVLYFPVFAGPFELSRILCDW